PSVVDPPVVAAAVGFTFGITLGPAPSSVPRNTVLPPGVSAFDLISFSQGLPDTVLEPFQSVGLGLSAFDGAGAPIAVTFSAASLGGGVAARPGGAAVAPPYTPESTQLQLQGAAA